MKTLLTILYWVIGISALMFLVNLAVEHDRKHCEEELAQELGTTAIYINGHCLAKGYGRVDGK